MSAEAQPSLFRLYLLRAIYLFVVVGIGIEFWPGLIEHGRSWSVAQSSVNSLIAALSVLALVGIRYPLQMLPVLFFELIWKTIWLTVVALPLWLAGQVPASMWGSIYACLMAVILIPFIPWAYVFETYVRKPGDRWW